jgi:hypothetical protein
LFSSFFLEQNNRIFSVLEELEYEEEPEPNFGYVVDNQKTFNLQSFNTSKKPVLTLKRERPNHVTSEHIKRMGLDPIDDKDFINELIRFYDFNLVLAN